MPRRLPIIPKKPKHVDRFQRTPRGTINNCALANCDEEKNCVICEGNCPDRFNLILNEIPDEPPGPTFADDETDQGESLDEALTTRPKDRSTARKWQAKGTSQPSPDSLELGEAGRIVERVFKFDFDKSYREVTEFLKPGDDRRLDLGFLQNELDRAVDMAALAHRLFTNFREACEIFEIDKGLIVGSMREAARYKLDEDRRNRIRLKAVTDADVLGMMQMQDPAKWRDHRIKTVRMEATRDHLERLSDLARKRIDVLKTLIERK